MATALKLNHGHTTQKRLGEGFLKVGATTISCLWNLQPLENFYYPSTVSHPKIHNDKQVHKSQKLITSQPSHHSFMLVSQK